MGLFSGITKTLFGGSDQSSSSTSNSSQEQYSTSQPWMQQAPYLGMGYSTAADLLQNGQNPVAPFSDTTQMAMGMIQDRALSGSDTLNSANAYNQALTSGFGIPDPSYGFSGLNALASTPQYLNIAAPTFDTAQFGINGNALLSGGNIGDFRDVDTGGNSQLAKVQSGYYLDNQNPYLSSMYDAAASDVTRNFTNSVTPTLNATFGAGGRTGSGMHVQSLGEANNNLGGQLQNMGANLYGNAYQFERGQQDNAANALMGNRFQTQSANQGADLAKMAINKDLSINNTNRASEIERAKLGAGVDMARLGLDANLANQNAYADALNRVLSSSNSISDNYFSGLNSGIAAMNAAPGLAAADYADISPMLNIGQMVDDKAQQNASSPYDMLNWYMSMIGSPVMTSDSYGTGTETKTESGKLSDNKGMFDGFGDLLNLF